MNTYSIIVILQSILLLIMCVLCGIYSKTHIMSGFSSKVTKIYTVTTSIALISLIYLIYYISEYGKDSNDRYVKSQRILLSCYLFFVTMFCVVFIKSKHKTVSLLNRIILWLGAGSTIGLFVSLLMDKPYTDKHNIAIVASGLLMCQAVIGDAVVWPKYFSKK